VKNLAGHEQAHELVCAELERAGVRRLPVKFTRRPPEVPARVVGIITHTNGAITVLSRAWFYYVTHSSKPLMRDPGMGGEVRVNGMSGGDTFDKRRGCDHFNVDSEEGLIHLVKCLNTEHGTDTGRTPEWDEIRHFLNDAVFAPI